MSHKDKHTNLGLELWNYPISGHFKIIASFHFNREECCCCCSTDAEHIFAQHHFIWKQANEAAHGKEHENMWGDNVRMRGKEYKFMFYSIRHTARRLHITPSSSSPLPVLKVLAAFRHWMNIVANTASYQIKRRRNSRDKKTNVVCITINVGHFCTCSVVLAGGDQCAELDI